MCAVCTIIRIGTVFLNFCIVIMKMGVVHLQWPEDSRVRKFPERLAGDRFYDFRQHGKAAV